MTWTPAAGLVDDVRRVLAEYPATDPTSRFERDAWASLLATTGPGMLTRDQAPAHLTASGCVLTPDGRQTCLILHRKVGLWLQPGGHLEVGDARLIDAAAREVLEETGLSGRTLATPALLSRHRAPCAPGVVDWHLDVQFVLVSEDDEPTPSDETPRVPGGRWTRCPGTGRRAWTSWCGSRSPPWPGTGRLSGRRRRRPDPVLRSPGQARRPRRR